MKVTALAKAAVVAAAHFAIVPAQSCPQDRFLETTMAT
jgi:hypothetical protein